MIVWNIVSDPNIDNGAIHMFDWPDSWVWRRSEPLTKLRTLKPLVLAIV